MLNIFLFFTFEQMDFVVIGLAKQFVAGKD